MPERFGHRTTVNVLSGRYRRVRRMRPLSSSDPSRTAAARAHTLTRRMQRELKGTRS